MCIRDRANAIPETNRYVELEGVKLLGDLWEEDGEPFGSQSKERWENLAKWMEQNNLLKKNNSNVIDFLQYLRNKRGEEKN